MARDIGAGHVTVTHATFRRMQPTEIDKLKFEMTRLLASVRGTQPDLADGDALRDRNRRIQRLTTARRVMDFYLAERRR